jgi:hypothetical protein
VLVEIAAGAGSGGTAAADDADFVDGTTSGTPVMGVYESTPTTVTDGDLGIVGITETRALKVSIASGGIAGIVDDAAFTPATSEVLPVGFTFDDAAVDSVNEGDIGAGRMSANRCQYVNIRDAAGNERGLNIDASGNLGIAANSAVNVAQATAGQVYGMWVTNTATTTRFVKFYNATAANVTVGSTTPVITIGIPGNATDDVSGNFGPGGMGIAFGTAITVAATTGVADADTGAPGANEIIVNVFYA